MSTPYSLHYEDHAAIIDKNRVPLVLLHAFPVGPQMWDDLVELLAGRNLVVDLPGFGNTPVPDGPANLNDAADALAATLDEAEIEKAVIAGLSLGGYVALSFLERHPERVAGLGLLDTQMGPDTAEKRQQRAETVQAVQESGTQALSVDGLFSPSTQQLNPLAISSAQQYAQEADPEGVIWALEAMAARPERTYVVRETDIPVLILAGEDDTMTPLSVLSDPLEELEDIAAVTVPNAGHLSAMEDPQAVAEALDKLVERAR